MNRRHSPREKEGLYRRVFRHSGVSLWLQDIARLREIIAEWRSRGVEDIRAFLAGNPEELRRAVHAIEVVDVNEATLEMYETTEASDLLGPLDRTLNLDDPTIIENMTDDIVAVAESRAHLRKESSAVTPSGRRLDIAIRVYVPPESSDFSLMLVNVADITDRKRLERGLEWERHQFHMLLDSATDRIYFKDREGRFTLANQKTASDFGFERPEQLTGTSSYAFFPPELAEALRREELEIMESGMPIADREQRQRNADGREHWFSTNKAPLRDLDGTIVGVVGITRDITMNKLVEEDRIRIERLEGLGQLASGIAHRFNNINAAAMGYLEMVMRSENLPQNLRGYLVSALEAILSSADVTASLQVLTGAAHSHKTPVRLETIAAKLLPEIEEQTRKDGVAMRSVLDETTAVRCAPDSMEFVVRSVVSNALHALLERDSPSITIKTFPADGKSYLEISDTGRGIPKSDVTKLFTPFFTTKGEWAEAGSPQARVKGVGLSLAVCRSLVSEQGGTLEIESREGSGTTVRITMPVISEFEE